MATSAFTLAGVDGSKRHRWIAVVADDTFTTFEVFGCNQFLEVIRAYPALKVVGVDIPIGLFDDKPLERACDHAARGILGVKKRAAVFTAAKRCLLPFDKYSEANIASWKKLGKGLSPFAHGLFRRIADVDHYMQATKDTRVKEVHPEVCFWAMNSGQAVCHGKKTREGKAERRDLLDQVFEHTTIDWCDEKRYGTGATIHDLYDAFAALWTARRITDGKGKTLPAVPPLDSFGLRMEINY